MKELSKDVDSVLRGLDPRMRLLTEKLRRIVKRALPKATETVKWGRPTYTLRGENVAWILNYRDHVDLGFFMGAKLKSELLEGTGKSLRHIKVRSVKDINRKEFTRLLKEAAKLV